MNRRPRRNDYRASLATLLVLAWSAPASAETFVVTQPATPVLVDVPGADCDTEGANDVIDVSALCAGSSEPCEAPGISLAEAICAANLSPGSDTIVLAEGTTYAVPCTHNSWYGRNALPIITSDIVIEGHGARIERVSADYCRFFFVAGAYAEAQAPTVGQSAPRGHLTLRELTLAHGWVRGGGGREGGGGGAGLGGAIYNEGTLDLEAVLLVSNRAQGGGFFFGETHGAGGGLSGDAGPTSGGSFGLNLGGAGGFGGANFGRGGSFIGGGFGRAASSGQTTGFGGGANSTYGPSLMPGGFGGGGGVFGDGGFGGGGGYDGNGGFGGGGGGRPSSGSGPGPDGGFGGGATTSNIGSGGAGLGGAIFNFQGTVRALNCTFASNEALGGSGSIWDGGPQPVSGGAHGGGIFNLNGHVVLRSTTLAGNTVNGATTASSGAPSGSDIYSKAEHAAVPEALRGDALVELHHCVLASSSGAASSLVNDAASAATLVSSVIGAENIVVSTTGNVASGAVVSTTDPELVALADNGGTTWTFALPSSQTVTPASAVPCEDLEGAALQVDQRGVSRPSSCCDPGAYQRMATCEPPIEGDAGVVADGGPSDAGSLDAGALDAGAVDAGSLDAGSLDAGSLDAGSLDLGALDAAALPDAAMDADGTTDMRPMGSDTGTLPPGTSGGGCVVASASRPQANPWLFLVVFGAVSLRRVGARRRCAASESD